MNTQVFKKTIERLRSLSLHQFVTYMPELWCRLVELLPLLSYRMLVGSKAACVVVTHRTPKRRHPSDRGAGILFFIGGIIPLLLFTAVIALDIEVDRTRYRERIEAIDREALQRTEKEIKASLQQGDFVFPREVAVQDKLRFQSPFLNALFRRESNEEEIAIKTTARAVPTTLTVIVAPQRFSLEDYAYVTEELSRLWSRFERPDAIPFEFGMLIDDNLIRFTSRTYRALLSTAERKSFRDDIFGRDFKIPTEKLPQRYNFFRYARNLLYTTEHQRHTQHVIVLVSKGDPYSVLQESPLATMKEAGLCAQDALSYLFSNIQLSSTKQGQRWTDTTVCPKSEAVVSTITPQVSIGKSRGLEEVIATMVRSVLRAEVIQ